MLRYFRDRVLTPVLRRMDYSTEIFPKLKPILLAVDFDTQESSFAYLAFDKILRRLLDIDGGGSDDETETQRSEDGVEEEAEINDGPLSSVSCAVISRTRPLTESEVKIVLKRIFQKPLAQSLDRLSRHTDKPESST